MPLDTLPAALRTAIHALANGVHDALTALADLVDGGPPRPFPSPDLLLTHADAAVIAAEPACDAHTRAHLRGRLAAYRQLVAHLGHLERDVRVSFAPRTT